MKPIKPDISFEFKRNWYSNKPQCLLIGENELRFTRNSFFQEIVTTVPKAKIIGFRYGIKWIRGFEFVVGREYQIYLQVEDEKELKLKFGTYYGINKTELHETFNQLLDALWDYYMSHLIEQYLAKIVNEETVVISTTKINKIGIEIPSGSAFSPKTTLIPWDDLGTKNYYTYYSLFSKQQTAKVNHSYYYLKDWNVALLYSVIETILRKQNTQK